MLPILSVKSIKKLDIESTNVIGVININKQNKIKARKVESSSRMQDSIDKVTILKVIPQDDRHPKYVDIHNQGNKDHIKDKIK